VGFDVAAFYDACLEIRTSMNGSRNMIFAAKFGSDVASIKRVTDLLGHATKEITRRRYRRKPNAIKPVR
jgi:hypothetical protein